MNLSDRARRDLDEIYDYLVRVADPRTARRFIAKLNLHLERIAHTGHSGAPRNDVRPGLRLAVHGRYNIYFRVTASETIIIRVLHSARDVCRLQFDDNDKP
ncbi:MAG: type II toxin-antitoxin system RelE/ParE family toxin [Hyphomicrobiaceae bacterium]